MSTKYFYIPMINLMHVCVNEGIKALCYGVTRGYFETDSLEGMFEIIDNVDDSIKLVDKIDKVRLKNGLVVYRQRVYFKRLETIARFCEIQQINFELTDNIALTKSSYKNISKDMPYLEFYAKKLGMSVENWLILVFRFYCYLYLKHKHLLDLSHVDEIVESELKTVKGLLDRAPYFLSVCDIPQLKYVVLQEFDIEDARLYTIDTNGTSSFFNYGFTNITVLRDKKAGLFGPRK